MKEFISQNIMDIISSVLAIVAIIVSIMTWKRDSKLNKNIAEKTLNQKFFEEIFFEYIVAKIPQVLIKLEYSNGNTNLECEELESIILEILDKAMFYKYFDSDFYEKIKVILLEIDEKLVFALDNSISRAQFENYKSKISDLINKLYKTLKDYYSGI